MRRLISILLLTIVLAAASVALGQTPALSVQAYIQELQRTQLALADLKTDRHTAARLAEGLPSVYTIEAEGKTFTVSVESIKKALKRFAESNDPSSLRLARQNLELLIRDAEGMSAPKLDSSAEQARLAAILARPEFQPRPESWWDRLKSRLRQYLLRLLGNAIMSPGASVVGRILLWAFVALTVALLAYWMVRNYREGYVLGSYSGVPGAISERPWRDWRHEAQIAAGEGRWRDAVHLSYWAGISFLEAQGLWRPDRARTPREYLRLLSAKDSHHPDLARLTRRFETVWYGSDTADESTFAETNELLERLGCR